MSRQLPYITTVEGHPVVVGETYIARDGAHIHIVEAIEQPGQFNFAYVRNNAGVAAHPWRFDGHLAISSRPTHDYDLMRPLNAVPDLKKVEDITSAFRFMNLREKELCAPKKL